MPLRPLQREQAWLLPPSLDELLPEDHSARFVAAFVDGQSSAALAELAIDREGEVLGAPAYHPCALLAVWLYGFMTGVRSSRKLEAACHDQIPLLWLTGCQQPDHNTLWRFYRAHRPAMRRLLKETVTVAVSVGFVDLAVQALDGTKVAANAAGDQTYDAAGLARLLERTEAAIAALEAQNEGSDAPLPPRIPPTLGRAQSLRERVLAAQEQLATQEKQTRVNLTDGDARLMKGRQGIMPAYNAQAMVSPLQEGARRGHGHESGLGHAAEARAERVCDLSGLEQPRLRCSGAAGRRHCQLADSRDAGRDRSAAAAEACGPAPPRTARGESRGRGRQG